jgi:ATP-dependent RNA helicase SUPV3L1/SUV3
MHRHIFRLVSPRRGLLVSGTCQRISIRNHFATLTPAVRSSSKPTAPPATSSAAGQRTPDLKQLFQREAPSWVNRVGVKHRLLRFGIPEGELPELLAAFTRDVENGKALRFPKKNSSQLARLSHDMSPSSRRLAIDQAMTSLLYTWAADPRHRKTVEALVSKETLDRMVRIRTAVDFTRTADSFPVARRMRRKLVLHVGPTNSGKTHTALRTLAAARVGAYGGPLRLLAHEIYQRLNTGQIVPLGAEAAETYEVDETSNFDVQVPGTPRAVLKHGNALFARPCSLLTGDDRRVVDGATLSSCTVEMLSLEKRYEVVVIDEIQMIADSQRGHAWTAAVLGTAADELHMCGEERAVPIIEALAEITGDELIINRYERLSPLAVAPKSLERDLGRIRKGDCVVTFSRTNIFNLKREIEDKTGLKCAVVYGRLPPEIRAEQAARFNDPKSGFDVLVASDAIGMGLNLYVHAHPYYIFRKC